MHIHPVRPKAIVVTAIALPFGVFAAYVAYLVVPEVLRVVIPIVVEKIAGQ